MFLARSFVRLLSLSYSITHEVLNIANTVPHTWDAFCQRFPESHPLCTQDVKCLHGRVGVDHLRGGRAVWRGWYAVVEMLKVNIISGSTQNYFALSSCWAVVLPEKITERNRYLASSGNTHSGTHMMPSHPNGGGHRSQTYHWFDRKTSSPCSRAKERSNSSWSGSYVKA